MAKQTSKYRLIVLLATLIPFFSYAIVADSEFQACKKNLAKLAIDKGFSPYITQTIISDISATEKVLILDKKQPEFSQSFHDYIKTRVTPYHVKKGKIKLKQHKDLFDELENKYGVPRQYLVAFWGLETYFGKHKGNMNVVNSIATLACDQRRSEFFTQELFDLFTLIDTKQVSVNQLVGSWAGAMGHMQFMPSAFLKYAVDGDGDDKVDIWNSEFDALTTAANYLNKIGWQPQTSWGEEVVIPTSFSYENISFDRRFSLDYFNQLGIKTVKNKELKADNTEAEMFLPAGHQGPAFLLYSNFSVIMTWNLSKNYALSVGLLSDLISEKKTHAINRKSYAKVSPLTGTSITQLQQQLNLLGYDCGEPDGIWGPNTRRAIRAFQLDRELIADGYPSPALLSSINLLIDNLAIQTKPSIETKPEPLSK